MFLIFAQEAAEKELKEQKEREEYEEYLKLKAQFTVDEEGVDTMEAQGDVNAAFISKHDLCVAVLSSNYFLFDVFLG